MGLDSLEIILSTEREFDLEIPDEDARRMLRVGDLCDFVIARTGATTRDARESVWQKIVEIVVLEVGVEPNRVTRDARFVADLGVQ